MDKLEVEAAKKKKGEIPEPVMREYLEKYEEIRQVRVPVEKDSQGNDVTPSREAFMKKGSKESQHRLRKKGPERIFSVPH